MPCQIELLPHSVSLAKIIACKFNISEFQSKTGSSKSTGTSPDGVCQRKLGRCSTESHFTDIEKQGLSSHQRDGYLRESFWVFGNTVDLNWTSVSPGGGEWNRPSLSGSKYSTDGEGSGRLAQTT